MWSDTLIDTRLLSCAGPAFGQPGGWPSVRRLTPDVAVPLYRIIRDFSGLERTVRYYHWGRYLGFDRAGHYLIETVEERRIAYDVTTGLPGGTE